MATDNKSLANFSCNKVHIDGDGAGLDVDIADHKLIGVRIGQGRRPQKLSRLPVIDKEPTRFAEHHHNLALLGSARQFWINPRHGVRIRGHDRIDKRPLLHKILIPIVTR